MFGRSEIAVGNVSFTVQPTRTIGLYGVAVSSHFPKRGAHHMASPSSSSTFNCCQKKRKRRNSRALYFCVCVPFLFSFRFVINYRFRSTIESESIHCTQLYRGTWHKNNWVKADRLNCKCNVGARSLTIGALIKLSFSTFRPELQLDGDCVTSAFSGTHSDPYSSPSVSRIRHTSAPRRVFR